MGGQGGCDRRIEKFLGKFTKKKIQGGGVGLGGGGGGGGGVRVDANEELKFLCKFKKKNIFFFGGGGGGGSGLGSQDGCERRIEVFSENSKKKKNLGGGGGGGGRVGAGSGWM